MYSQSMNTVVYLATLVLMIWYPIKEALIGWSDFGVQFLIALLVAGYLYSKAKEGQADDAFLALLGLVFLFLGQVMGLATGFYYSLPVAP